MTITLPRLPMILAVCVAVPVSATVLSGTALASARTAAPAATNACHQTDAAMARAELSARSRPVHEVITPGLARARQPYSAKSFADDVLGEAVIPPHSTRTTIGRESPLAATPAAPAVKGLTDVRSAYRVNDPAPVVQAYEETHLPKGAELTGTGTNCIDGLASDVLFLSVPVAGSHEYSADIAIGVASLGPNSSLLRVDAQVVWVPSRPAKERPQAGSVLRLTIFASSPLVGNTTITLRGDQASAVTDRLDSLPLGAPVNCAERSPLYRLQYLSRTSTFSATGYGCADTVLVSVNGKSAASLYDRNLSLVGLMNRFLPSVLTITDNSAGGWAGWVNSPAPNPPGQFESTSATWFVPKANCDFLEMAGASEWTGIDGFGNSVVEQAGTQTDCVLGQGTYATWFELFGSHIGGGGQIDLPGNDHVHPGDEISVEVVAGHGPGGPNIPGQSRYRFDVVNSTERWVFQTIQGPLNPEPPNQTAEWIVEQPSCFWVCQALTKYGKVTFAGMSLTLNSANFPKAPNTPPGDEPGFPVNLMTGTTLKETGSNLFNTNTEVVTFVHK